jgi:hypothetical protein
LEIVAFARRGWRLVPCKGKKPFIKRWPQQATCDVSQLEAWAEQFIKCNWAATTGPESGFFVLDLDGNAGLGWLAAQVNAGNELPETWTVRSARGLHLYFAWPAGLNIRTSTNKPATGVDIRGAGGCVVIPPSVHPDGPMYAVVDDACPVAPAPLWLLKLLCEPAPASATPGPAVPDFEIVPEGHRNDTLTRKGGWLRRKGKSQAEIETELLQANQLKCRPPLPSEEIAQIAASVARYPVGGPDPLETAWNAVQAVGTVTGYLGFIKLAQALQTARLGLPVALPLERIAALFGVHFTSVQQWRKKAVATRLLEPVGQYIAHRKAGTYRVLISDSKETKTLTKPLTKPLTTGLVRVDCDSIVRASEIPIVRVADSQDTATSFAFGFNVVDFPNHEKGIA